MDVILALTTEEWDQLKAATHISLSWDLVYINLEAALLNQTTEEFNVKTAKTLEEACKLVEVGFDYVTEMDGVKTSENASNITLLIPSVKN